jgi:hypothetical protein
MPYTEVLEHQLHAVHTEPSVYCAMLYQEFAGWGDLLLAEFKLSSQEPNLTKGYVIRRTNGSGMVIIASYSSKLHVHHTLAKVNTLCGSRSKQALYTARARSISYIAQHMRLRNT